MTRNGMNGRGSIPRGGFFSSPAELYIQGQGLNVIRLFTLCEFGWLAMGHVYTLLLTDCSLHSETETICHIVMILFIVDYLVIKIFSDD
jgi:hypothetical protein